MKQRKKIPTIHKSNSEHPEEESSKFDLNQLPNDIIVIIADFLPSYSALNNLARTATRFYHIVNHTLYRRNVREDSSHQLLIAIFYEKEKTVEKFLSVGADVEVIFDFLDQEGCYYPRHEPPLAGAARRGNIAIAKMLINAGAKFVPSHPYARMPLFVAAQQERVEVMKYLLTHDVDVNAMDENGENLVTAAVRESNLDMVRYLLTVVDNPDDATEGLGQTALIAAIRCRFNEKAKLLLKSGKVNPEPEPDKGISPLIWATTVGSLDIVKLLLEDYGVNPNTHTTADENPIVVALRERHVEIVKYLMKSGRIDIPADSIFSLACENASIDVAKELLKMDIGRPYGRAADGTTWLHIAASHGRTDIVKLLLKRKDVSINEQKNDGATALICAAIRKRRGTINALLKLRADVSLALNNGFTVLHAAADSPNHVFVQELLDRGCEVNARTAAGETPLHQACRFGNDKVVSLLLEHGADPTIRATDDRGISPIHTACIYRWERLVTMLLKKTPKADSVLVEGWTPLYSAIGAGHTGITKLILEHGANPAPVIPGEESPIRRACRGGHPFMVQMLDERGADLNEVSADGMTLLHQGCVGGHARVVSYLLKRGANPNAKTPDGKTPLTLACRCESLQTVRSLVKNGALVNDAADDGSTPLHEVCRRRGSHETKNTVQLLLDNGADIHARTQRGETPLYLAARTPSFEAIRVLLDYGADPLAEVQVEDTGNTATTLTPVHQFCRYPSGIHDVDIISAIKEPLETLWRSGWTPLHEAAAAINVTAVKRLLEFGAYPMALTATGRTALHEAVRNVITAAGGLRFGRAQVVAVVQMLLDAGIDANHRDNSGKRAIDETGGSHPVIKELLRKYTTV